MTPATTIPADLLPGLLDGWCGPVEVYEPTWADREQPSEWRVKFAPSQIGLIGRMDMRLDLTRPEAAWRLCVVLAAGARCRSCDGMGAVACGPGGSEVPCLCDDGYLRKPAPAWHLLPVKYGGQLPDSLAQHSAALLGCHARRVAAGKETLGLLGNWRPADSMPERQFRPRWTPDGNNDNAYTICEPRGWRYGFCKECGGPETGDAGMALADEAALKAGWALVDVDLNGPLRVPE